MTAGTVHRLDYTASTNNDDFTYKIDGVIIEIVQTKRCIDIYVIGGAKYF